MNGYGERNDSQWKLLKEKGLPHDDRRGNEIAYLSISRSRSPGDGQSVVAAVERNSTRLGDNRNLLIPPLSLRVN